MPGSVARPCLPYPSRKSLTRPEYAGYRVSIILIGGSRDAKWIELDSYDTLEELEATWREEDVWKHDLRVITDYVKTAGASDESPAGAYDDIVTWLAAVQGYWREHPAYPELRDVLLTRLVPVQEADERRVTEHREQTRQLFAARV